MAKILNANRAAAQHVTVDPLYARHLLHKTVGEFTQLHEPEALGNAEGLNIHRKSFANDQEALKRVHAQIAENKPFVALVNYAKWDDVAHNSFDSGRFVVVTGSDEETALR